MMPIGRARHPGQAERAARGEQRDGGRSERPWGGAGGEAHLLGSPLEPRSAAVRSARPAWEEEESEEEEAMEEELPEWVKQACSVEGRRGSARMWVWCVWRVWCAW